MKTHRRRGPLSLHRETLAALTGLNLKTVAGGAFTCGDPCTGSCPTQRTCPITHCPVTHCP